MAINVPIRLGIKQDGAQKGYVEAIDFRGASVSMDGPIARIHIDSGSFSYVPPSTTAIASSLGSFSSQIRGLAAQVQVLSSQIDTLEGRVAVIEVNTASVHARGVAWMQLGVAVSSGPPVNPCVYSDWLAGSNGVWGWVVLP